MHPAFILIHGGFHAGWCWERLVPLLEAKGHAALAPDLPGMGLDGTPHDRVTLASTTDFVVDLVRSVPGPVVLVGHSMGGMVIGEVAERIPNELLGLAYVTATLIATTDRAAHRFDTKMGPAMSLSSDGHSMICDPHSGRDHFFNTTPPELAAAAVARLQSQPLGPMKGPITATLERFGSVPRAFIECTEDRSIPIAHQRRMQAALPCDPVFTLETDHSPFLCNPKALAETLLAAAMQFGTKAKARQQR